MPKSLIVAGWLTWISVISAFIGLDWMKQRERSGYEKLFNIPDKNPLLALAEKVGPIAATWFPLANIEMLERQIIWAGKPFGINPELFIGLKFVAAFLGVILGSALMLAGFPSIFVIAVAMVAYFIPDYFLRAAIEQRQKSIRKELPMMLDFLSTSLRAGVELVPALNTVGNQLSGALGEELRKASREIATGKPRAQALKDMAKRTGVDEVDRFVQTLVVAEERGVENFAVIVDELAKDIRTSRLRKAEEEARKLSTKIVAPLILCIFLPMIILILVPIASVLKNALF